MIKITRNTVADAVPASISNKKGLGEKLWDYQKGKHWEIFLTKDVHQLDPEKQRGIGAEIFSLLGKEVSAIAFNTTQNPRYLVEGMMLASYRFDRFLSKPTGFKLNTVVVPEALSNQEEQELQVLQAVVFWTRDMVNLPVSHLNAKDFAEEIKSWCESKYCKVEVMHHAKIKAIKMGGLLAVNKGSVAPPTFTTITYKPKKAVNKKPIVLVGKGVVYDTGGLSLKPTPGSMDSMKCDMAGAALVAGAIKAMSMLNIPVHIIGLIPATDNRPGGDAYTPGDVITMYNKSTVEVLNTDAEGRMILADALSYADKFKPQLVISAATLTGAAVRAIGTKAAIAMGNAPKTTMECLIEAGNKAHERLVHFPFWDEYLEPMKSDIADLKNIGGPDAGMITAGKFLETFTKSNYIHLDVAGPIWLEKPSGYLPKGGTGFGVRLLLEFLANHEAWLTNE